VRNLTLRQLRALAAIGRSHKIATAAAELGLTGPAVTLQLQQLERETGFNLFDRTTKGLRPTEAGEIMLETAAQISSMLSACEGRLAALHGLEKGRLSVGVVSTAKYFVPSQIAAFSRLHPGVAVQLRVGNRNEIIDQLRTYQIDLAIMGRPPNDIAVASSEIGPHPLVIVAAPEHRLARRRNIPKAELYDEIFLIREEGSGTRISMEIYLGAAPKRSVDLRIEMGSNETIKQAAIAGLGIAFISGHTTAAEIESGRLVALDVEGLPILRKWFTVRRADKALTPAVKAFCDFLVADGSSYLPRLNVARPAAG